MLFIDGLLSSVPCGRVADPPTTKKCTSSEALRRFLRGPALQVKCSREGARLSRRNHRLQGNDFPASLPPGPMYVLRCKHTTDADGKPQTRQTEIKVVSMY